MESNYKTKYIPFFCRHGKIQSVKIHAQKDSENATNATVAFTDIKSAAKAHNAENRIETNLLCTEYSEGSATGKVVTRTTQGPGVFPHPRGPNTYTNRNKG